MKIKKKIIDDIIDDAIESIYEDYYNGCCIALRVSITHDKFITHDKSYNKEREFIISRLVDIFLPVPEGVNGTYWWSITDKKSRFIALELLRNILYEQD